MIGYFDTSAFVPLLVAEPTSELCRRFWNDADDVVSCPIMYVEAAAALAQAQRMGRLTQARLEASLRLLDELWCEMDVIDIDQSLLERAAILARQAGLRGYDAVHCAAAEQIKDDDLVAATGDARLLSAWHAVGVATFDTNGPAT